MMAASVDFFDVASPTETARTVTNVNDSAALDEDSFANGFGKYATLEPRKSSTAGDFFAATNVSPSQKAELQTSKLDSLLSELEGDTNSNYFKRNDVDDDDDISSVQTPTSDWLREQQRDVRDSSSDFFETPRAVENHSDDEEDENDVGDNVSDISKLTPRNSNIFQADDIDLTSRSALDSTPEPFQHKSTIIMKSHEKPTMAAPTTERSLLSDVEFTERSITIDAAESPGNDVPEIVSDSENGWSPVETPTSTYFKPPDSSSVVTNDMRALENAARSDITTSPDSAIFGDSSTKSLNQKQKEHESYISRKYNAMQKQRENQNGDFKSQFVNEMLSRAQENRRPGSSASTSSRPSSASKYPRGIQLSKTFTKNTNAKTFQAWSETKHTSPAHTVSEVQDFQDELGVVCTTPPLTSQPGVTTGSTDWQTHPGFSEQTLGNHPVRPDSVASTQSSNRSGVPMSPGIVDEAYYQSLLRTTPIPNPSTPVSTDRTSSRSNIYPNPHMRKHNGTYTAANRAKRPSSAPKTRPSPAEAQKPVKHQDQNGGFTVSGKKIETGPKHKKTPFGRYRSDHKPSYVDELLFGNPIQEPNFPSPFGDTRSNAKPLPFVAIAGMEPPQKNHPPVSTKTNSAQLNKSTLSSSSRSNIKTRGKQHFSNTYVDEGLFGPKPEEPSFKAPWNKGERRKPFVFDGTDYKANKPLDNPRAQTPSIKKPVWK